MKTSSVILLVVIVVLIVVGVWFFVTYNQNQYATGPATYVPTSTVSTSPSSTSAALVSVGQSPALGTYLTAENGMTLYKFTNDTPGSGVSTCTGQCAVLWPPYTIPSSSSIAEILVPGATGTFDTITRSDGTIQLTYNGYPLYYYAKDAMPGDTNGQNVGGVWFVVNP